MAELPEVAERTLPRAFARTLERGPDRVSFIEGESRWSYGQAYRYSLALAGGLISLGGQRGRPILLMLDNSLDAVWSWLALGLTGQLEVPVNTAYKGEFLRHIIEDSAAEIIVVEDRYCARLALIADGLSKLRTVVVRGGDGADLPSRRWRVVPFTELNASAEASMVDVTPDELIGYLYTSGTTGRSKGVRIPHAQAYTYATRDDQDPLRSDAVVLVTLPLFHVAGQWYGAYQALIAGARCVIEPGFSASAFWDQVRHHGATDTLLLGATAQILVNNPPSARDTDHSLRTAFVVPLPADVAAFRERFGVEVATGYGMTEAGGVLAARAEQVLGTEAGFVRAGYQVRVVDERDIEVPDGTVGQLVVRPDVPWTTMDGYHNLPEQGATAWRNLWLHTGDGFRREADGRFYFCDRMKDALRRRGENVSSVEVEAVVAQHPDVLEAAVVAVPSPLGEDDIKAVVVLRDGAQPPYADLLRFLIDRLPYFMVPRYLEYVGELPRTPTQKVEKHRLRSSAVSASTWDRESAGITVTRQGQG